MTERLKDLQKNILAGGGRCEFIFYALMTAALFIKFYCMELSVSPIATRYPLSVAASLGVIIMLLALVSLSWRRVRPYLAFLVDFLMSLLAVTDVMYMRYYSDLFSIANIGLSSQVGEISESVTALFSVYDLLFFADIPLLLAYVFLAGKRCVKPLFGRLNIKRTAVALLVFAIGASCLVCRIIEYQSRMPDVLRSMWDRPAVCNNIGALSYHAVDMWNVAGDLYAKKHVPESELDEISDWFSDKSAPGGKGRLFGAAGGKNLIIIQVESLQQFVVGLEINGEEVTPNLNRFIRDSIYFSRVYNQTGAGNSSDAEFLANAGMYPSSSGVAYTRFAGNTYEALPKLLADNGYCTLALHGDRPGFWNRQHMYPALGFQRFVSKLDFNVDEKIGMGLSDKSFFRQSLQILSKEQQPFYAFLITLTSHYPFNFDGIKAQTKLNVAPFESDLMGDYLRSIKYFDTQFGMFIAGLKKSGLYDRSVIFVYGDHTAIPAWDAANLEKLLGRGLQQNWQWREVEKVPLIVHIPGRKIRPRRNKVTAAGLVDVPNTAAALLGFRFPMGFGDDLFAMKKDLPVIFRNGSYILGGALIEPSASSATDLRSGRKLDFNKFTAATADAKKRLQYSDRVLEHDLVNAIKQKRSANIK